MNITIVYLENQETNKISIFGSDADESYEAMVQACESLGLELEDFDEEEGVGTSGDWILQTTYQDEPGMIYGGVL